MNTTLPPSLGELLDEFLDIEDWEDRYYYLIDLGKQLPPLSDDLKTPDRIVKGCMSTVWLDSRINQNNGRPTIELRADSDALIVKGLIVVILAIFNHRTPEEILKENEVAVLSKLGLTENLSPQRRNGLFAMVKRIKQLALEQASK